MNNTMDPSTLWPTGRVAREAQVSNPLVHKWVARGDLTPALRTQLGMLFRPSDVQRFIEERKRARTA